VNADKSSYYVVAQLGRKSGDRFIEIDYMLETILFKSSGYLLLNHGFFDLGVKERERALASGQTTSRSLGPRKKRGHPQIDVKGGQHPQFDSENNNHKGSLYGDRVKAAMAGLSADPGIQSAGNFLDTCPIDSKEINRGSSETIRQLSSKKFQAWLAGIIDGDGNFDLRKINNKLVLKAIRIKFHVRDIKILNIIQNKLHFGRIKHLNNNTYCLYIVSTFQDMTTIINLINGLIRLKVDSFKKACDSLNIPYIEPNYTLEPYDPYFSGLIDTDGSIVFNYSGNRIECNLEIEYNEHSKKLVLDNVIPNYKPSILLREKKKSIKGKKI